jgi:AcrR family transcriptional regulator
MRRPNVQLQSDRRAEILDAAQRCFVRSGFHQTSMQEICAEAGMSPGNLYRYFPSKVAIIEGIAERDRAEMARQFASASDAPDFFTALEALARHHFVETADEQMGLCTEIMAESRRNPEIARISRGFDVDARRYLIEMMRTAAERGEIASDVDFDAVITMLMLIADGVWWRRTADPNFDAEAMLPLFVDITRHMLRAPATSEQRTEEGKHP